MILRHTVVFPEAVPPATPIKNGPLEADVACPLVFDARLALGKRDRGGLPGGVNGEDVSLLRSNSINTLAQGWVVRYRQWQNLSEEIRNNRHCT